MPESFAVGEQKPLKDLPTPLKPESYRDFSVQRKIIGFFVTGGDTIVFKQPDFDATQNQATSFSSDLAHSKYKVNDVSHMLELLPDGLGAGTERKFNLYNTAMLLEKDVHIAEAMSKLIGKASSEISIGDIEQYLANNPSPIEANKTLEKWVNSLRDDSSLREFEAGGARLLDQLYGERQVYWQNFRLMMNKANSKTNEKGRLKPQSSRIKKLTKKAASLAISASLGTGPIYMIQDAIRDGRVDGPWAVDEVSTSRKETEQENLIEQKYGIEILDIREAFRVLGINFDIYDENQLGDRPPTRWSEDQIKLLDELLSKLPPNFYTPKGEALNFSLTDYGKECPCAGTFHENRPNLRHALVLLSDANFRRDKGDWPIHLLTHELAHRVDIDVLDGKLWPKVNEILELDSFSEAKDKYVPKLGEVEKAIEGLDSIKSKLNYGFLGIDNQGKNEPTEFIAVLAEIYIDGPEEFAKIGEFLGTDRTQKLYELLKMEMFEGMEYESKPNPSPEPTKEPIQDPEEKTDLEYAAEDKHYVEEEFNVIINDSDAPFGTKELNRLRNALSALPKSLLQENEGKKIIIKIDDDEFRPEDSTVGEISFSKWEIEGSPNAYTGVQQGITKMTSQLIKRYSDIYDSEPVNIISNFIKDEIGRNKKLLDDLEIDDISQLDEVAVTYSGLYIAGWERFGNLGMRRLDHAALEAGMDVEQAREQESFTYRLYKLIGEIFYEGNEYAHGIEDGIPFVIKDNTD